MKVEDICLVDMEGRRKRASAPPPSEVKTHIAMMKSVGVNSCIHAHPPHCNAFLFARPGSALRHQSGSGHFPGAHPAGPLRNARLPGNGPGRCGGIQAIHRRIHGKPRRHRRRPPRGGSGMVHGKRGRLLPHGPSGRAAQGPLNQVGRKAWRTSSPSARPSATPVPEGQPLYNTETYAGYKLGKSGK